MTCDIVRNRLLSLPDPAVVPAPLADHLESCPTCHAWHLLFTRVDGAIAATAPPPYAGAARRKLVEQFRGATKSRPLAKPRPSRPVRAAAATVQAELRRPSVGERLARLWPVSVVAAAVLVGVLVWASFR